MGYKTHESRLRLVCAKTVAHQIADVPRGVCLPQVRKTGQAPAAELGVLQNEGLEEAGGELVGGDARSVLQQRRAPRERVPRQLGHPQSQQYPPDGPLAQPTRLGDIVQICVKRKEDFFARTDQGWGVQVLFTRRGRRRYSSAWNRVLVFH